MAFRRQAQSEQQKEFDEKVVEIKRLSKKTKGGNQISFSALVVIGDHKGKGGVAVDKAKDVVSAIQKAIRSAKKKMITINLADGTIPHEILYKRGASTILLKPAPEGTGVIAGGAVRAVVEAFGVRNIVSKSLGTANKASNVFATFEALQQINSTGSKILQLRKSEKKAEMETNEKTEKGKKTTKKAEKKTRIVKK
ncbi:MAG: 30S ribosomal protein S5 [Patescibacteria group bacterium]|jgi:small subunit ribosomal protein S5